MTSIESELTEKIRFGHDEEDMIIFCRRSNEGEACYGIKCPMYQNCWKELQPDKEGYFILREEKSGELN